MEWLEFNRWSAEVEQHLAHLATRCASACRGPRAQPPPESAEARAHRLQLLLERYPRSNPWGHPAAEC
ncbi:hypothetical protein P2318_15625 [Myxococcaceae bacterium GXIMD 01537]